MLHHLAMGLAVLSALLSVVLLVTAGLPPKDEPSDTDEAAKERQTKLVRWAIWASIAATFFSGLALFLIFHG